MGFRVLASHPLPVNLSTVEVDIEYRVDLLVENEISVELEAIQQIAPIHKTQLLTYLKLSKKHLGLTLNFKDGVTRMVNELPRAPLR